LKAFKYILMPVVFLFAVFTVFFMPETSIGGYINSTNPAFARITSQLPIVFKYSSIYVAFLSVLSVLFVFLNNKCSAYIRNMTKKLDDSDQLFWRDHDSFTGVDRKYLLYLSLFSLCVVTARNWSCILYGYFKYDDFEFFSTNRTEPLLSLVITTHGDHLLPLYRMEVALMNFLFGVSPLYYNIFVSSLFALLLIIAGLLLREMRVSQLAILLFAILCVGWIDWGEITAGYFCVSVYVQITLLSMVSVWSYFRWEKTFRSSYIVLTIICMGAALLLDISGVWVPLGVIIFAVCEFSKDMPRLLIREWLKSHQWLVTAVAILYVAFAMLNLFVFFFSKHGAFLSMSGDHRHTMFSFLLQLFYLISGGLLLTPLFPIGFNVLPSAILIPLLVALSAIAVYILLGPVKNAARYVRWRILSVVSIILITASIVVVGRPMAGFNYALVAKYTGVLYLWFCLLISLIWNHYWNKHELPGKSRMAICSIFLFICFIGHQTFFDNILFLSQAEATGYKVNVAESLIRKNSVTEMRQRLILPLFVSRHKELHIPSLDGNYIFNIYPKLFKYNLSHYMDFIVPEGEKVILYKNKAMQEWSANDVVTVNSLRSHTDPEFITLLENDSYAQRLYLSPVELKATVVSNLNLKNDSLDTIQLKESSTSLNNPPGSKLIHSNGASELFIDSGAWDPEKRHVLILNVGHCGAAKKKNVNLEVQFTGELKIPYSKNFFVIPSGMQRTISIDLLQIYSYSLNPRVGSLRITFPVPGDYLVSSVKLI
jgi:hypothetical protein